MVVELSQAQVWKRGWSLLDARERREALNVLALVTASALFSALMVGSVMPFLYVLAQPTVIHTNPYLHSAYTAFGFSTEAQFLVAVGAVSIVVVVAAAIMQVLRAYVVARFSTLRVQSISQRLLAAYLNQPYTYFLDRHTGTLSTQILSEAQQVVTQFFRPAANVVASGLAVFAIVGLLILVNPTVAIVALGSFGVVYSAIFLLSRKLLTKTGQRRMSANQERFRITGEALGGIKYVKLKGLEANYEKRFSKPSRTFAQAQVAEAVISELPQYAMHALAFGGGILFCIILLEPEALQSGEALSGILPLVGLFAAAAVRIMPELARVYQAMSRIQASAAVVDQIYHDLACRPSRAGNVGDQVRLKHSLRLAAVSYHYPTANGAGVSDVTLTIRAGERLGIVGTSGAGKTTLADVILGLLAPSSGCLFADGVEITPENIRGWQRSIGYVPQEVFLIDASVAENIAVGIKREDIDEERILNAARAACIDRFIQDDLPNGFDTTVGERGVRLSGGQRQRIGIARALYSAADLIVLDEATSALDGLTERELLAAIDDLPGETTLVMIAHRLSTLRLCDRIVVMREGRVADVGTWTELVRDSGQFRRMAEAANVA